MLRNLYSIHYPDGRRVPFEGFVAPLIRASIIGRRKRNALALSLRLDRRLSGRSLPARAMRRLQGSGFERPVLTRVRARELWHRNRLLTANSLRADRRRANLFTTRPT